MSTRRCLMVAALFLCGIMLAPTARGQVKLIRSVIGSGATAAANSTNGVAGTLGQTIIGRATSSTSIGYLGFWFTYPGRYGTGVREEHTADLTGAQASLTVAPNPVTDHGQVAISLPVGGTVSLKLFDALGRERLTLIDGRREAGTTTLDLSAADLASGDYTLVLVSGGSRVVSHVRILK